MQRAATLKDGSGTGDRRLDRIPELDPRSRGFGVTRRREAAGPVRSRTWRLDRRLMGDQGQEGACVEFGLSHVLAASPVSQPLGVLRAIRDGHLIYWPAQAGDPWPGGSYPGASPVYEGTSELTGLKVAQRLGFITGYSWAFGIDEAVAGVVNVGPANLALGWTEGMMDARPGGLIRDEGDVVGGHDVAMIGVRLGARLDGERHDVAVIAQSWGLGYGDRGRVYLPLSDLERRLADDGTCAFVDGERRVAAVPADWRAV